MFEKCLHAYPFLRETGLPILKLAAYSLILVLSTASCRSYKDLTYFRDVQGRETIADADRPAPIHRIQEKDNLYVSIISTNVDMNKIYNPSSAGAPESIINRYEGVAGQFINGYEVDRDGNITLPVIGKIMVLGQTFRESEQTIAKRAKSFLKEVTVKVRLLNYRVTINGEVRNPGVYYNYNYDFTVLDAISMANGVTDFAQLSNILIIRPEANGKEVFEINLNSKSAILSDGYYLQPNDVVIVQPSRGKNQQLNIPQYSLILTSVSVVLLLLNYLK
jgi:polysaccharide export outer membrane protein